MNKREIVWLIIRLIGVYFVYLTVVSLFSLVGSIAALNSLASADSPAKPDTNVSAVAPTPTGFPAARPNPAADKTDKPLDPSAEKAKSDALKTILWFVLLLGIYGLLGFYLLRHGRILFEILNREDKPPSDKEEIKSLGILNN
jgi:hypothetical protein